MNLRRILYTIALAAPLTGCPLYGCPDPNDEFVVIGNMPAAELVPLVNQCEATHYCDPLCNKVYERHYGYPPNTMLLECELFNDPRTHEDTVRFLQELQCIGGRRPVGYRARRHGGDRMAAYLCEQTELEAASVQAFHDLHDDLVALGAPTRFRRAARSAAADEIRHAAMCGRLARRFGATPVARHVAPAPRRTRIAVAIDNLVEGCVRETYGAVLAGYQGRAASDRSVRTAMKSIARDEAGHAALSWKLHAWLWPQLSAAEQRDALAAAKAARAELGHCTDDADLQRIGGMPDAAATIAILSALDRDVWSAVV